MRDLKQKRRWVPGSCLIAFFCIAVLTCHAQQKMEIGVAGGASLYTSQTAVNASGEADAGFASGFAFSVWVGNDMYDHLSGEGRYTYGNNNPKLTSGGNSASFSGDTHTLHYDLLIHVKDRSARTRPYFSVGGGAKYYRGTGAEQPFQPLQDFALLTNTSEWKGVVSFGGGVMFRVKPKLVLRIEVKDYLSPLPTNVIQPAPGASLGGWIHNIVPMFGLGFRF